MESYIKNAQTAIFLRPSQNLLIDPMTFSIHRTPQPKETTDQGIYLVFPLTASSRRISTWNPFIQKIKNKLALQKGRVLSQAGCLALIKSTLTSLPLYFASIFCIPKGVVRQLNTLINGFFRSGDSMNRKCHRVNWKIVTRSKKDGGLGIQIQLYIIELLC